MKYFILLMMLLQTPLMAGKIHSYVDQNGVKVLTNLGVNRKTPSSLQTTAETLGVPPGHNYTPLIQNYSEKYGVDSDLVHAIIQVESNFDASAVSSKDCKGLMQLHPDTADRFGVNDVFDPADNIEGGVRYLSYLIDFFDRDIDHVLAAYNAGENAVVRHRGIPPYSETKNYVRKVRNLFKGTLDSELPRREYRIVRILSPEGHITFTNVLTN